MSAADRMARAGDFVLGLMGDEEHRQALADLETDTEFRDAVARLAMQMQALDDTVVPEPAPDALWQKIEARIADAPAIGSQAPVRAPVAAPPPPEPEPEPGKVVDIDTARRARPVGAASLGGWRGGLLAASILAACGLGFMVGRFTLPPPQPVVVVVLADDNQQPGAIVEAYGDDRVRIVPLTEFEVPAGKTLEVWTLYDQQVGPVSLGTFARPQEIVLRGPDLPAPQPNQLYEITLEDAPGSPVGRPTGPILVKGLAQRPAGF
jgi:anti-sigma-K factor RskA